MATLTLLDGVTWDGVPVPGERGHQLLAMLAMAAPRAVAVGDLVERLWPDDEPTHPEKALQVLVSRTRSRTGPDAVAHGSAGYRLGLREDQVDALRLRQLVRQAREAADAGDLDVARHVARDALAVAVDPSAEGPLGDLADAARVDQAVAGRLLGRALLARGEAGDALPLLERALVDRPRDEEVAAEVLRAEAATHGVPAALERYAAYVEQTLDATGAEPGEALRQLHAELLARDAPVRQGLQYDASPMVGRDEAVADVRALLAEQRVVSIVGPGGLGKTRMAHLVGRLAPQPVVYFVELAGVNAPEGVLGKVAADLGVRESISTRATQRAAVTDLRSRVAEKLTGAPSLLVLDNCEHLVAAVADLVAFLVATTDRTSVLTTSRAPLGIAAEAVYSLAQLAETEAVELFGRRARAARPGVRLETDEVTALVRRLDGLPLAIELAAAKVRAMAVAEISRRLEDRFALLAGGDRSAPERHQTLESVIDWSWNLLRVDDQQALRRLAVFPDGFALAGAEALLGRDPLDSLAELADQSLVVVTETESALRYRFLETVREYGLKQLDAAGEREATDVALRSWAVDAAAGLWRRLATPEQVVVMGQTRVEVGNLAGVLHRAIEERDAAAVVPLAGLLADFWSTEGDHMAAMSLTAGVLDVLGDDDASRTASVEDVAATVTTLLVNELVFTGRSSPRSLSLLRELEPPPRTRAWATREMLLTVADADGDLLERLDRLVASTEPGLARFASLWTSHVRENAGDLAGARRLAERALSLCDGSDGPWSRAIAETMLAGLDSQAGDPEGCIAHARAALVVLEQLGATQDCLELRSIIALSDITLGRLDRARSELEAIARNPLGDTSIGWSAGTVGLAELALAEGDVDRGLELYRRSVQTERERRIGDFPGLSETVPWVVFAESAALWAHVVTDRAADGADLAAALRPKAATLFESTGGREPDVPVAACAILALGGWDLLTGRDPDDALTAITLANRLGYQRALPCMAWARVQQLAEDHAPGLLAATEARYAERPLAELREEALAAVTP